MAARDYKHRARKKPERRPLPAWIWLLIGFLLGAGLVGYLCYRFTPRPGAQEWIGDRPPPAEPKRPSPRRAEVPPPEFKFYDLLPDQEVVVPEEELRRPPPARSAPKKPEQPARPQPPARGYLLQVAAMRSAREAETVKAKLALLGYQARVSRATIKGATWYRVRLGPFRDTRRVQQVRKRLAASGFRVLVVRER